MVRQAIAVRGEATSEEIAAFIEQWHGVKIAAKFIPVYKASIEDKATLDAKRRAAQALAAQAIAEAKAEEQAAAAPAPGPPVPNQTAGMPIPQSP